MIVGAIAAFLLVRSYGEALAPPSLVAPPGMRTAAEPAANRNSLFDYDLESVRPAGFLRVQRCGAVSQVFFLRLIAHHAAP